MALTSKGSGPSMLGQINSSQILAEYSMGRGWCQYFLEKIQEKICVRQRLPCVRAAGVTLWAPAKAQSKRVWWGEEVRRRERDLPRLSGARRVILSPHRRVGGIDRLTAQVPACQPGGDAPRWGFLLSGQKKPKPA